MEHPGLFFFSSVSINRAVTFPTTSNPWLCCPPLKIFPLSFCKSFIFSFPTCCRPPALPLWSPPIPPPYPSCLLDISFLFKSHFSALLFLFSLVSDRSLFAVLDPPVHHWSDLSKSFFSFPLTCPSRYLFGPQVTTL